MKRPWSISTTIRNPDRLRDFLYILKELEGQEFTYENQIKYQILLIKNKLYQPINLTKEQKQYYESIEKEMPISIAREIFNAQNYEDPAMRGRNSAAPLNKMGLCIAKKSMGSIKITSLGEYFLSENYDLGKLFFIHFLKWQLPNLASDTFSERDGFLIKPFIGLLHLINEANHKWKKLGNEPVGISKDEFSLFGPTLIDYRKISEQADILIAYRTGLRSQINGRETRKFREKYRRDFAKNFLGVSGNAEIEKLLIEKLLKNLNDYGDNAIRYFRLTRYIHIRGSGYYVDLEPRRSIELEKLLAIDNAAPLQFENTSAYVEYLADLEQPTLPWETKLELQKIANNLSDSIRTYIADLKSKSIEIPRFKFQEPKVLSTQELNSYTENLRTYRLDLRKLEMHFESQDIFEIEKCIDELEDIHRSNKKKSIELEKLTTFALNALNDALKIKPNYPVGDDSEPTFTAPANKPDIECFYEKFNSVCEVTMLTNRSQWYNEGQPVMRHVRDFEKTYDEKKVYCLFIAPKLHQDTVETFWMAVKYGYKGTTQKIVPLPISQFIRLLQVLLELRKQNKELTHEELLNLYEKVLNLTNNAAHSGDWIDQIPGTISEWQKNVLEKE